MGYFLGLITGLIIGWIFRKTKCRGCPCKEVYEFETGNKFED